MYCPKCGKENPDGAQLCSSCNWVLTISTGSVSDVKTHGLAIASFVLAILSPIGLGIIGVIAIILGVISLRKINNSNGTLKGKKLAIAGIVIPSILIFILIALVILLPILRKH